MESERNGLTLGLKVVKIVCSLIAFVCAMIVGLPWQIKQAAFFNIMQLLIMVYAVVTIILHVTKMLGPTWWKTDCIITVMLACIEFAATTLWSVASSTGLGPSSLSAMTAFGYLTGIVCIAHVSYLIQIH